MLRMVGPPIIDGSSGLSDRPWRIPRHWVIASTGFGSASPRRMVLIEQRVRYGNIRALQKLAERPVVQEEEGRLFTV